MSLISVEGYLMMILRWSKKMAMKLIDGNNFQSKMRRRSLMIGSDTRIDGYYTHCYNDFWQA